LIFTPSLARIFFLLMPLYFRHFHLSLFHFRHFSLIIYAIFDAFTRHFITAIFAASLRHFRHFISRFHAFIFALSILC